MTDAIEIPPPGPGVACPQCGGIFEQSVKIAGGGLMKGHVPGGPLCVKKAPVLDKRERRKLLLGQVQRRIRGR